jgi:lipopolysaccharide export LptBFGC system permease protein LptF
MTTVELQGDSSPKTSPTTVPEKQETTRGWLAKGIFLLFAVVILVILGAAVFTRLDSDKLNFLLSVLSAITGTLGFVMGFYFGQNQK